MATDEGLPTVTPKTYQECEQSVDADVKRAMENWDDSNKEFYAARLIGFLRAKVVQLTYEIEQMRDKSNTEEMHALLERLGGK